LEIKHRYTLIIIKKGKYRDVILYTFQDRNRKVGIHLFFMDKHMLSFLLYDFFTLTTYGLSTFYFHESG